LEGELGSEELLERWFEIDDLLSNFKAVDGNWLSQVRNDVTYQLAHSAWFPHNLPVTHAVPINMRALTDGAVRLDYDSKQDPIAAFTAACTFLVAITDNLARQLEGAILSDASTLKELRRMRDQASGEAR
jgi:hypothetical protein